MFKVPAEAFKIMVAKAARGASCNKIVPVTSLIQINLTSGTLCLSTTDTENTLEVYRSGVDGKDMEAVVGVELFSKLIAKQTCDVITINPKKDYLEVKGNGVYKVPLVMDEEGVVQFPEFTFKKKGKGETVNLTSIQQIVDVNSASVSTNADKSELCAYYVHVKAGSDVDLDDAVLSTNEEVVCYNRFKFLKERAFLTPVMLDLLTLNTAEKIQCFRNDGWLLFETEDIVLHGPEHDGIDDFPLATLVGLDEEEFPSSCEVSKAALQSVLDRLALFIEAYDKNGAHLNFTKDGLQITSKQSSSDEILKYRKSENFAAVKVLADIPLLKAEVDSTPGETVTISYGSETAIAISSGNVKKIIALLEVDGEEELEYAPEEESGEEAQEEF